MRVFDVMAAGVANALRERLLSLSFEDGSETAGNGARPVKANRQLTIRSRAATPLLQDVRARLMGCSPLCIYILPRDIVTIMFNQYGPGEAYGWHTDNPYIEGKRTDVSFTLFLTDPEDYEGGELEIRHKGGVASFKGRAGQAVVYSTGDLHRVTPVTRGSRVSAVGWITSWVGLDADRETLFEMQQELTRLAGKVGLDEIEPLSRLYQKISKRLSC
ncbi:MAG: Fe2+-dependent dioxygenase [Schleiferiaceae bacterium]